MKFVVALGLIITNTVIVHSYNESPDTLIEDLPDEDIRIVNGQFASPGQFPWQILSRYAAGDKNSLCGGTLICDSWILTAAHCVKGGSQFKIYLGSVNYTQTEEPGRVILDGISALYHPSYNPSNLNHDIALIQLSQRVKYTNKIRPIPLDDRYLDAKVSVTVSGWGKTKDNSPISPRLKYVNLKTITNTRCISYFSTNTIKNETLCCQGQNKEGTCNGDSGGPLISIRPNGQRVHIGIASFVSGRGCEKNVPSIYVRTASYLNWIKTTINGTCQLPQILA